MFLIDNVNLLREDRPVIWDAMRKYEDEENRILLKVEDTKRGEKTLALTKDNKKTYLHSKYNPLKEAETIMESYKNINEDSTVIFYGTGLGYHIKFILEKYSSVKYYIYEPIPELMYNCLSNINLKELKSKRLLGMDIGLGDEHSLSRFVDLNKDGLIIVELPSHKQNFPAEYKVFSEMLLGIVKDKRRGIVTDYSFQKRWILNSMKNFGEVLSTPNIIMQKKGEFKDKPAILVAAGPSLNEEIENLKYIKENGLAYIFSVGSAINTLIHHGIYPDAACTYDPGIHNQKVFETTKEKGIKEIPMIFGSSVGYETLLNYPGKKYHMITSQDAVGDYYLKAENDQAIGRVSDAPSIAIVTLGLLYQLGFSSIILVGQNLAYKGKERYSEGISYSSDVTDGEMENGIWTKDVQGNEILTNDTFESMRMQMEYYIRELANIKVINTTKGGAHIEGTGYVELNKIIEKELKEKVVEENWLEGSEKGYDKEYLARQIQKMDRAYIEATKKIKRYYKTLDKINQLTNNRNFKQVRKMYISLGSQVGEIEDNDYFKTFILPMNRVEHKMLVDNTRILNNEKDDYQKGKKIVFSFKQFMDICTQDMEMIKSDYNKIQESMDKICNTNSEG